MSHDFSNMVDYKRSKNIPTTHYQNIKSQNIYIPPHKRYTRKIRISFFNHNFNNNVNKIKKTAKSLDTFKIPESVNPIILIKPKKFIIDILKLISQDLNMQFLNLSILINKQIEHQLISKLSIDEYKIIELILETRVK